MMTVQRPIVMAALALLALPAAAQDDVEGKWNASIETPQGAMQMVFNLMVEDGELKGSMSNDFMGENPISEGMVDGNEVAFKVMIEGGPGGAMTINYKGMVEDDTLTLTSTFEGGGPPGGGEQTLTAMRAEE
jgi:hypothetical protein